MNAAMRRRVGVDQADAPQIQVDGARDVPGHVRIWRAHVQDERLFLGRVRDHAGQRLRCHEQFRVRVSPGRACRTGGLHRR